MLHCVVSPTFVVIRGANVRWWGFVGDIAQQPDIGNRLASGGKKAYLFRISRGHGGDRDRGPPYDQSNRG
jgi:hypothetical protein